MVFYSKVFPELSGREVYEILKSRSEVFLMEQNIVCLDADGKDYESLHCFFEDKNRIVAYLRAFSDGSDGVVIGRVLSLSRKKGIGRKLMEESAEAIVKHFSAKKITVHAQKQAVGFYEKMGFIPVSSEHVIEGIPHITMEKQCIVDM